MSLQAAATARILDDGQGLALVLIVVVAVAPRRFAQALAPANVGYERGGRARQAGLGVGEVGEIFFVRRFLNRGQRFAEPGRPTAFGRVQLGLR